MFYRTAIHGTHDHEQSPENIPDLHGFVMMGTEELFLDHLPMFHMENHRYQVILKASLPPDAMNTYIEASRQNPDKAYILGNVQTNLFTLPQIELGHITSFAADVFCGVPQDPAKDIPLIHNVTVTIERVVHFRHFAENMDYPQSLTYILFGQGKNAYISHYLSIAPDFHHIMELAEAPDWLHPELLEIGSLINFPHILGNTPFAENPLTAPEYQVQFQGQTPLYSIRIGKSIWFDDEEINHGM
ncbi:hypothetical protein QNH46_13760 [Paenibacillus woosongensis]|uniref:Uncharacterized protein n=1 Tax=Paenibacillus woosongensis TaxID=307580 RepID=A0AA95I026_9BACL|nr:hypothetical protein [Paenibacillus woosongensis]WHX47235.1 hypothetical protein QNH46_13760 [Paenibacillus woosongensis]